jgi:subtilisin family serine protease
MKFNNLSTVFIVLTLVLLVTACSYNQKLVENINSQDKIFPVEDSTLASHIPGQILLKFNKSADREKILSEINGEIISELEEIEVLYIKLAEGKSVAETINYLNNLADISYAQPNYIYKAHIIPNDPRYTADEQWGLKKIEAEDAWNETKGSDNVVIAVLDTGVDADHEDLYEKVMVSEGYNTIDNNNDTSDVYGHGTHVSGIAAGISNNYKGIAGIAWNSPILPVKVLSDSGDGSDFTIASGILYSVNWDLSHSNKRVVINMSLGGTGYSTVMQDAVNFAIDNNVPIVASMGNDYKSVYSYPAACQGAIAVGATSYEDKKASFSTTGNWISVSAPGLDILSSVPNGYERWDGTSMAAPHVTGAVALILSLYPNMSPAEVKTQLEETADDLGTAGFDIHFGYGRINLNNALAGRNNSNYGSIEVSVINSEANPFSGVNLVLYDNNDNYIKTTQTNNSGIGLFHNVPAGQYYITVSYSSSTKKSNLFNVTASNRTYISIILADEMFVSLSWVENVDIDLGIREPNGNYYEAWESLNTPNGSFNKDALSGSYSPKIYTLNPEHLSGDYEVYINAYSPATISMTLYINGEYYTIYDGYYLNSSGWYYIGYVNINEDNTIIKNIDIERLGPAGNK